MNALLHRNREAGAVQLRARVSKLVQGARGLVRDFSVFRGWVDNDDGDREQDRLAAVSLIKAWFKGSQERYQQRERDAYRQFEQPGSERTLKPWYIEAYRFLGWHSREEWRSMRTHLAAAARVAYQMSASLQQGTPSPEAHLPRTATRVFWSSFESRARSLGISLVGYTRADPKWMYNDVVLPHPHVVVLAMEMDKDAIDTAPQMPAGLEALRIYDRLGHATLALARYLREQGYDATAQHPAGGIGHTVPLAVAAGMGALGHHGLLITPELGPRVRLAAIYTNAVPIAAEADTDPSWISSFCSSCNKCVRRCPADAIYDQAIQDEDTGDINALDCGKCEEYFFRNTGCAVCLSVCPFTDRASYDRLYAAWSRRPEHRRSGTFVRLGRFDADFDARTRRVKPPPE